MTLALLALTVGAFAIGTTEFVIVGLMPTIANDLSVTLPSAGLLVSFYALGVAIGAPLLTAITGNVGRKTLLVSLMVLFTLANLAAWCAPGYDTLVIARIFSGLAHGVFFSVGSIIATNMVPKDKGASAIATMFSGLTVAFVTGVPLGTFVGQHFGWRVTFLMVAAFGLIALISALVFVPRHIANPPAASLRQQAELFLQPRLLLVFAMTIVGYGGSLIAFTYLAAILQETAGFSPSVVGLVLLLYGASVAVGNMLGGKLADSHGPIVALKLIFALLAGVLFLLEFAATNKVLVIAVVLAWGAVAFGNVPALQVYVVKQAERFAPHSVGVASGMNIAAFNLGVAGGAWTGGAAVDHLGLMSTPWIGALVVLCALGLTWVSGRIDQRDQRQDLATDLP
jgi:predicted MFS family arabinose efflux permease